MGAAKDHKSLFRYAAAIGGVLLAAYLAFTVFPVSSTSQYTIINDVCLIIANALAAGALVYAMLHARQHGGRDQLAWGVLALAQIIYLIGDVVWFTIQARTGEQPFPSLADLFYLGFYPLFIIGLFLLPARKPSTGERLKISLDVAIVTVAATLLAWNFLIAPTLADTSADWLLLALSAAYPVLDLVLFFTLFMLLFRQMQLLDQRPLLLLELGVALIVFGDVVFTLQNLQGGYIAGGWSDRAYIAAYIIIGLAGLLQAGQPAFAALETAPRLQRSWIIYLPYAWGAAAYLLLVNHDHATAMPFPVIAGVVGLVFTLILFRQVVALRENERLYQAEARRRYLAESLGRAGQELTGTLEFAVVLERIMDRLATVVPYERCSIMLQEERALHIVAQRGFPEDDRAKQVRIAIRDDDIYLKIVGTREPVVIDDVTEVPGWRIMPWLPLNKSWMGVPLVVRDQVIGMFSVTRRNDADFSPDEPSLAVAFAGQAAVALQNARLYNELSQAYSRLEILDKTKAKFIEVAAHELRTPLTVIKGYTQVLAAQPAFKKTPEITPMLDGILHGMARMHEIVNSMLDVAKIDNQSLELIKATTSLDDIIQKVISAFAAALRERHLILTVEGLNTLPKIHADPDLLQKVFSKLIVNAIKYTPDGGRIKVKGIYDEVGRAVEIIVSDNGIGIAPDQQEVIFEKLYQGGEVAFHSSGETSFKGGGPGLGLAIARGFVLAHGGKIWVESSGYDEAACPGSAFHVRLPL